MAIKVAGTTVIDDSRNICNAVTVTATTVCATNFCGSGAGLTSVSGTVPTGAAVCFPSGSAPAGYIAANGGTYDISSYPTLATCLGGEPFDNKGFKSYHRAWGPSSTCSFLTTSAFNTCLPISNPVCCTFGMITSRNSFSCYYGQYEGFCCSVQNNCIFPGGDPRNSGNNAQPYYWTNQAGSFGPCCQTFLALGAINCGYQAFSVSVFRFHDETLICCIPASCGQVCNPADFTMNNEGCCCMCKSVYWMYGAYCCGLLMTFSMNQLACGRVWNAFDFCCGCCFLYNNNDGTSRLCFRQWCQGGQNYTNTQLLLNSFAGATGTSTPCNAYFMNVHFLCALGSCRRTDSMAIVFGRGNTTQCANPNVVTNQGTSTCPAFAVTWYCGTNICMWCGDCCSAGAAVSESSRRGLGYAIGCDRLIVQGCCGLWVTCINTTTRAPTTNIYGCACGFGNGLNWGCGNFISLDYFAKCNVFVGIRCNRIETSSDGVTWTCRYAFPTVVGGEQCGEDTCSIISGDGCWTHLYDLNNCIIAMSPSGYLAYSSDACTWTCRTWNERGYRCLLAMPASHLMEKCEQGSTWYHGWNFRISCDLSSIQLTAIPMKCTIVRLSATCYYAAPESGIGSVSNDIGGQGLHLGIFNSCDSYYWCHVCGIKTVCVCESGTPGGAGGTFCCFIVQGLAQWHAPSCSVFLSQGYYRCGVAGCYTLCQYFPITNTVCCWHSTSCPIITHCDWAFGFPSSVRMDYFVFNQPACTCNNGRLFYYGNSGTITGLNNMIWHVSQDCACAIVHYRTAPYWNMCCAFGYAGAITDAKRIYYIKKCSTSETCGLRDCANVCCGSMVFPCSDNGDTSPSLDTSANGCNRGLGRPGGSPPGYATIWKINSLCGSDGTASNCTFFGIMPFHVCGVLDIQGITYPMQCNTPACTNAVGYCGKVNPLETAFGSGNNLCNITSITDCNYNTVHNTTYLTECIGGGIACFYSNRQTFEAVKMLCDCLNSAYNCFYGQCGANPAGSCICAPVVFGFNDTTVPVQWSAGGVSYTLCGSCCPTLRGTGTFSPFYNSTTPTRTIRNDNFTAVLFSPHGMATVPTYNTATKFSVPNLNNTFLKT